MIRNKKIFQLKTRRRKASVLILVVVLLVLLALIGTAYLTSSRNDRLNSLGSIQNANVDQYTDGIANVVSGKVIAALFDSNTQFFRQRYFDRGTWTSTPLYAYEIGDMVEYAGNTYVCTANGAGTPPSGWTTLFYHNFDTTAGTTNTNILADRIPSFDGTNPYWAAITPPLFANDSTGFASPFGGASPPLTSAAYTNVYPTYITANGVNYPALFVGGTAYPGCDADGDGIADSFLFPIPGAYSDGLTWYAGVRVIDNNSALNASVAWDNALDGYGLFPTNVGLQEALNTSLGDTIGTLNGYRFNGAATGTTPIDDSSNPGGNSRTDFQYLSQTGDAFYHQLAQRLLNPGYNTAGVRFNAVPASETAVMARHFGIVNTSTTKSILEQLLPYSTYYATNGGVTFRSTSYGTVPASDVLLWYNQMFNYDSGTYMPLRPYVVTSNPVSNYIPPVYNPATSAEVTAGVVSGEPVSPYMLPYGTGDNYISGNSYNHYKGTWSNTTAYVFNDIVLRNGYTYICVVANTNFDPALMTNLADYPNGTGTFVNYGAWQLQPFNVNPAKTNVNTATFRELFRAYYSVMCGNSTTQTPFGPDNEGAFNYNPYYTVSSGATFDPQFMFRSVLRDPTWPTNNATVSRLDPVNVMALRAAIAAVDTLGMRDATQTIVSRTIQLNAHIGGPTAATTPIEARVYSSAPQPFITEVYASNDSSGNDPIFTQLPPPSPLPLKSPDGYVAIELFNPYPFPLVLNGYQAAYVSRPSTAGAPYPNTPGLTITPIMALPQITIQPYQFALLENYNSVGQSGTSAGFRPTNSGLATTGPLATTNIGQDVFVTGLENVLIHQGEFVLLRPRRADGTYTSTATVTPATEIDPLNLFNEGSDAAPNLNDLVPVDSYDFTNMTETAAAPYYFWNYNRGKGARNSGQLFMSTFPGRYSVLSATATPTNPRQEGTSVTEWVTGTTGTYPPLASDSQSGPAYADAASWGIYGTPCSYPNAFAPIQVVNGGVTGATITGLMPGPNPTVTWQPGLGAYATSTPKFPFGLFARNGDIQDVTFMGAYRLSVMATGLPLGSLPNVAANPTGTILELNSLPMDCSLADSNSQKFYENVGRFCPLSMPNGPTGTDTYSWARNLFTYLTVQAPSDNYSPNFDPGIYDITLPAFIVSTKYWQSGGPSGILTTPVYGNDATLTDQTTQDNVGVQGLININTASWRVLMTLPGINEALAKAIVLYRTNNGPFTSIFDLNKVEDNYTTPVNTFQNSWGTLPLVDPTSTNGLLCPPDPTFPNNSSTSASGVIQDFQGQFAELTRISNLITTRSDTFTVYICVQGWQNAGTSSATAVITRRFAFVVDRSAVNSLASSRFLKTLTIPNN